MINTITPGILKFPVDPTDLPGSFIENYVWKGSLIDLYNLVAKELSLKAKFIETSLSKKWDELKNSEVDLASAAISDLRKQNFDFSEPFFSQSLSVIFRTDENITDNLGLKNKKIAILSKNIQEWLNSNVDKKLNTVSNLNVHDAISALRSKDIDVIASYETKAKDIMGKNSDLGHFILNGSQINVAFMVKKGNADLLEKVNKALTDRKAVISAIFDKWNKYSE